MAIPQTVRNRFFARILVIYVVILSAALITFTNYATVSTRQLMSESLTVSAKQVAIALRSVVARTNSVAKEILFRIYADRGLVDFLAGFLNAQVAVGERPVALADALQTSDAAFRKKEAIDKLEMLSGFDNNLVFIFITDPQFQVEYVYDLALATFEEDPLRRLSRAYRPSNQPLQSAIMAGPSVATPFVTRDNRSFVVLSTLIVPGTNRVIGRIGFVFSNDELSRTADGFREILPGRCQVFGTDAGLMFDSGGDYGAESIATGDLTFEEQFEGLRYKVIVDRTVFGDRTSVFANSTFVAGVITILLIFVAYFSVTSVVSRKTRAVVEAMDSVVNSNLIYRMPESAGKDEFSLIARYFNRMCDDLTNHINMEYRYESLQRRSELRRLEAQVDPHFLYNSLETIRAYLGNDQHREGGQMIQALAVLFRASVKAATVIQLKDELRLCEMFLSIYNHRMGNCFDVEFQVDDRIQEFGIPKNLLQPIVENYVLYGFDRTAKHNAVRVVGLRLQDQIVIQVIDNGSGIDEQTRDAIALRLANRHPADTDPIGLWNVHERLRLLFGSSYGVSVLSGQPKGTIVEVRFPVSTVDEILNKMGDFGNDSQ